MCFVDQKGTEIGLKSEFEIPSNFYYVLQSAISIICPYVA
jgi:hypothetical protein